MALQIWWEAFNRHIHEAHPSNININISTYKHIIVNMLKDKDKKEFWKQQYNNDSCHTDFSSETMGAKRQWNDILKCCRKKVVNQKSYIQQINLPKIKIKKTFQINKNWESVARRPILQDMLNKFIKVENKRLQTVTQIIMKKQRYHIKVIMKDNINVYLFSFVLLSDLKINL